MTRISFFLSFRQTSAVLEIRFEPTPFAISPKVLREQGQIIRASGAFEPEAQGADKSFSS